MADPYAAFLARWPVPVEGKILPTRPEYEAARAALEWLYACGLSSDHVDALVDAAAYEIAWFARAPITPDRVNSQVNPETYVPIRLGGYGLMLVNLDQCVVCSLPMVRRSWDMPHSSPFPPYDPVSLKAQAQRAGWVFAGKLQVNAETICERCERADRARAACYLCKRERKASEVREAIGDPPEYLCTPCYDSVPARVWDRAVKELEEAHRWDHE